MFETIRSFWAGRFLLREISQWAYLMAPQPFVKKFHGECGSSLFVHNPLTEETPRKSLFYD
ncbi:hypothetical protein ACTHOQ_05470 [Solibacillus silvestris]|uniref:hypothetical protein n=1 Tax=Solibacillus silvestris TaxID=76853 RepID=UPI003F819078